MALLVAVAHQVQLMEEHQALLFIQLAVEVQIVVETEQT
jgi:hypothetical protein